MASPAETSGNERYRAVVELRAIAGLPVAETASVLGVSERTVKGDWAYSSAWLAREIAEA